MRYPQIRLTWNSSSDEPPLPRRLGSRLLAQVRSAVQRSRRVWRLLGARMPRLRQAAKGFLAVAAVAVIVVLGMRQRVDTPTLLAAPPTEAASDSQSPADGEHSAPAPWGVRLPHIPTPGPHVFSPVIGFHDLPDLSAELEEGFAMARIRSGTASDGLPPHLNAVIVVSTLALVVLMTTVPNLIRGWRSSRQDKERNTTDTSAASTGTEEDEPLGAGAEAAEPMPDASSDGEASVNGDALELLAASSVAHGYGDLPGPTATGTPDVDQAAGIPPSAGSTRSSQDESPPRAAGPGLGRLGPVSWPPTGRRPAVPSQPTERRMPRKEEAASRVVLFAATKWDG